MISVERTIISQYCNSPTLVAMVQNIDQCIDPRADFDNFFNFVWNVDTAQGFGLDIWGRIVNIGRVLQVELDEDYFGFEQALPDSEPFNQGVFFNSGIDSSYSFRLEDEPYRKLILTKALANICKTNAPSINQILKNLFADRGKSYVQKIDTMKISYTFEFKLTALEYSIIKNSGAVPTPAGVEAIITEIY